MFETLHIAIFKMDVEPAPYIWLYRVDTRNGWRLYDASGSRVELEFMGEVELVCTASVSSLERVERLLGIANAGSFHESNLTDGIPF